MEVNVAIDTNKLTDLFRGDEGLRLQLEYCEQIAVPLIVLAELRAGFLGGSRLTQNETLLERFLRQPVVSVLLPTVTTASYYARLFVQLRRAGTPVPDNDLWIAAQCLEHRLALVTRDKHFEAIPQLDRL